MKRCVILLLLIIISFVNAEPLLEFQHNDIQSGETILATINTTGEFTKQIKNSDLVFYKGRRKTIFEHDIIYYDGVYYVSIYANRDGEFELRIENILYKENESLKSFNIIKPFNITTKFEINSKTNETITKILGIHPGVIYYPRDTNIKLYNSGTSILKLKYGKDSFSLEPLSTKVIEVMPEEKLSFLKIKGYKDFEIPVIYATFEDTFSSPLTKSNIKSNPDFFVSELFTGVKENSFIQIYNLGDDNITDIKITTDVDFLQVGNLKEMTARQIKNLSIKIDAEVAGHFEGVINITYMSGGEANYLKIPVSLFVLPKGANETQFEALEDSCDNLNGQVCGKNSICEATAQQRFTSDRKYCCFGECVAKEVKGKKNFDYGWVIALVILAALGWYGYYVYKKQKNITPKKSGERIKESINKYEKRISVKPKSTTRVKGNLQKS